MECTECILAPAARLSHQIGKHNREDANLERAAGEAASALWMLMTKRNSDEETKVLFE